MHVIINIEQKFLPSEYQTSALSGTLDFIIQKVNHKIAEEKWETSLSTISIPPTKTVNNGDSPVILAQQWAQGYTCNLNNHEPPPYPLPQLYPPAFASAAPQVSPLRLALSKPLYHRVETR